MKIRSGAFGRAIQQIFSHCAPRNSPFQRRSIETKEQPIKTHNAVTGLYAKCARRFAGWLNNFDSFAHLPQSKTTEMRKLDRRHQTELVVV